MAKPYKDEELLNELYNKERLTIKEIAEQLDCSPYTVHKYGTRYNIGIESLSHPDDHDVNDESLLRELHVEREMSVNAIANKLDVSRTAVKNRLEDFGIQRNYAYGPENIDTPIETTSQGYERINTDGQFRVHKLVALLDNDPNKVFGGYDYHVHHKNGIEWDNRPENLEVVSSTEHMEEHAARSNQSKPYTDEDTLHLLYHERGMSQAEIADKFGISQTTVSDWLSRLGIDSKGAGRYKDT